MQLRRREFITLLSGAVAAWPIAARAQQAAMPVVMFITPGTPESRAQDLAGFRKGLSEMGYVEGRNLVVDYRLGVTTGQLVERQAELAAELVRSRVNVIVVANLNSALAVKAATTRIPIVFNAGGDPVATGLVASLNRPGGNVTGISSLTAALATKRLGLLHELVPRVARVAVLVDPITVFAESTIAETRAAAAAIGVQVEPFTARTNHEIDAAFAGIVEKRAEALLVAPGALFINRRVQIASLAMRHAVPVIYDGREFAEVGGLLTYGSRAVDRFRQVGIYAGRILKGERPADLPVVQPTKFEFVINLQTARTLGIEVPPTLLAQADEVIE